MDNRKNIFVTQPTLAPLKEFTSILEGVWERGILTHNGPLVQELETKLEDKLDLAHLSLVSNGTIALQMAIRALSLQGEIITTPFTWVATISAIKWEGCVPVFCDIDKDTLNIDPDKIEECITDRTVAIMPVHVFGNPCEVERIKAIAEKHNLKIIYDAAHALGSRYNNESLLNWGDISAVSLHATKLLNTAEGGGCITTDSEIDEKLRRIRFFGHDDRKEVVLDGFNGKMTEIHAALGLANLNYFDQVLDDRREKYLYYQELLEEVDFISFQKILKNSCNYSYFPVIIESEERLINLLHRLELINVYPRRYFYPAVNTFNNIVSYSKCPIAEDISKRILCLPLYYSLDHDSISLICDEIKNG